MTDGEVWQFGMLVKDVFTKNRTRLPVDNIDRLFGVITYLIREKAEQQS